MDAHALTRPLHSLARGDQHHSSRWSWVAPLAALTVGVVAVGVLLDGVMEHGDLSL